MVCFRSERPVFHAIDMDRTGGETARPEQSDEMPIPVRWIGIWLACVFVPATAIGTIIGWLS